MPDRNQHQDSEAHRIEAAGREPLMGLSFVIWKSQEFLQAPDMID